MDTSTYQVLTEGASANERTLLPLHEVYFFLQIGQICSGQL